MTTFLDHDGADALQEVYLYLDHHDLGDRYIAWYGQRRAEGNTHAEAMQGTVDYFRLEEKVWYQRRTIGRTAFNTRLRVTMWGGEVHVGTLTGRDSSGILLGDEYLEYGENGIRKVEVIA